MAILFIIAALFAASLIWLAWSACTAPEGFEDHTGFHEGRPDGDCFPIYPGAPSLRRNLPAGDGSPAAAGGRLSDPLHAIEVRRD